jgi:molybdopterin converting factor small subunit
MADRVSVRIPTPLRGHTGRRASRPGDGRRGAAELARRHELRGRCSTTGRPQPLRERSRNTRTSASCGLDSKVKDGDGVKLVPAIAGGSWARSRRCGSIEAKRFRA